MKTHILLKAMVIMAFTAIAVPSYSNDNVALTGPTDGTEVRMNQLTQRLEEIKAMDIKTLSKDERKALRTEVKAIKKEMAATRGGVYLSVGAIIIIVLLLILLL